jgi:hypothetical protein
MSNFKVQISNEIQNSNENMGRKIVQRQFIGKLHFVIDSFDIDLTFGF